MPDAQPDEVTAYLDDAQKRYQAFRETDTFPELLAAVEAVRKLAGELECLETAPPSGELDEAAVRGIRWTAVKVREAISRELLSEGSTDA